MNVERTFLLFFALTCSFAAIPAATAPADETEEGHAVRGIVQDRSGNPVEGAIVTIGPVPSLFEREDVAFATTAENGAFSIPVTYPGNATVSSWHPAYVSTTQLLSTDNEATLTLQPGEVLEGSVTWDEDLNSRAVVSAYFPGSGYQAYGRADDGGNFRFANLPNGKCEIEVRVENTTHTRWIVARSSAFLISGKANRLDIPAATEVFEIAGTVKDETGLPLAAEVTLHVNSEDVTAVETLRTNAAGEFAFTGFPAGEGKLAVRATGKASTLIDVEASPLPLSIVLEEGLPLRCSFLNSPDGTRAIEAVAFFGKIAAPGNDLAGVRALFDQPMAWRGTLRSKNEQVDVLKAGKYTLLAYPVAGASPNATVFEIAEGLRLSPVHMDSFSVNEGSTGSTIAAAFPADDRPSYAAAQQPMHPIIGTWAYEAEGSVWTRTFTPKGRCVLMEGPLRGWDYPYVILGESRVAVITEGNRRRMHVIQPNGTLDVEGQFTGTKVR